jgi:signal transduction histidine kinase
MQPANYHPKLFQQISQSLGSPANIPPEMKPLLQQINASYTAADTDYQRLQNQANLRTEQLIASTSRAYSFLDSLNMGLIICDVDGQIVLLNRAIRRMLGDENAPWNIASIAKLLAPNFDISKFIGDCLRNNQALEEDEVAAGERTLRLSAAPMTAASEGEGAGQHIGAIVLAEDITEQRALDRSKDEFLSIASHELRTPLTAIRGNTALIKKYYLAEASSDLTEMISDIHESAVRLIDIVNDFLSVSSLEQGKVSLEPQAFALAPLAREVGDEVASLCQDKGLELVYDPSLAAAPEVNADRKRTKQVIYNLIGNALKFTDSGSITLSASADASAVAVTVADTGRGMSAESQRLLFRKFQQAGDNLLTRDTTKGTGLGLYISRLITEQSGGKIWLAASEEGKGSNFSFSLPRA